MIQALADVAPQVQTQEREFAPTREKPRPVAAAPQPEVSAPAIILRPRIEARSIHQLNAGIIEARTVTTDDLERMSEKIEPGATASECVLAWLNQIYRKRYLPFRGPSTLGLMHFRVHEIDKSCAPIFAKPTLKQILSATWHGQTPQGDRISQPSKIPEALWKTDDQFIVLTIPLLGSDYSNKVMLIQGAVLKATQGDIIINTLQSRAHTQTITEFINLLLGLDSFGGSNNRQTMDSTSLIQLPGKLAGQQLARIDSLQVLPNFYFNGNLGHFPKKTGVVRIAH